MPSSSPIRFPVLPRQLGAVLERQALDRHERHHVGRAHARVLAPVLGQVDQLAAALHRAERRLHHRIGLAREGEHGAVVVRVHLAVEQRDAGNGRDGLHDLLHHLAAAAFREVRDAFDELGHGDGILRQLCGRGPGCGVTRSGFNVVTGTTRSRCRTAPGRAARTPVRACPRRERSIGAWITRSPTRTPAGRDRPGDAADGPSRRGCITARPAARRKAAPGRRRA